MFKYQCRGCKKVISLKAEHLGRKLKCKCGLVFRAPEKTSRIFNSAQPSTSSRSRTSERQPAIEVSCTACFTTLQAKADWAGKTCKCKCGEKIQIPSTHKINTAQTSSSSGMDMTDPMALPLTTNIPAQTSSKFQTRYNNPEAYKPIAPPKPTKKASLPKRTKSWTGSSSNAGFSSFFEGPVIAGIGMMLGATIWFVVGLSAGYIFFYPPILFCIGLGSVIKGLILD